MKSALFEHIKHRMSETAVPDPDQGWQEMNRMLDNAGSAGKTNLFRWWYAAACLLLVSAGWALLWQSHNSTAPIASTISRTGARNGAGRGNEARVGTNVGTEARSGSGDVTKPINGSGSAGARAEIESGAPVSGTSGSAQAGPGMLTTRSSGLARSHSTVGRQDAQDAATHSKVLHPTTLKPLPGGSSALVPEATEGAFNSHPDIRFAAPASKYLLPIPEAQAITSNVKLHPIPISPIRNATRPSRWGLRIGLAANTPGSLRKISKDGHNKTSLGIYPIGFIDYRLTRRWTVKAGLALPAPVAYTSTYTHTMVSATVNDSLQTTRTVSENKKIGRLIYLDIPVTAQFNVLPHLSVEAGVQLSQLLTEQEDTRTASTISPGFIAYTTNATLPTQAVLGQMQNTQVVRKSDPRCLLGANYQLHRFNAGLQYQGGLLKSVKQTDEDGNIFTNRTSIVRMQISYQLR